MRLTRAHRGLGGERRAGVLVASGMLKTVCAKHPWEGLWSLRPMVPGWLGSSSPSFLPCFRPSFLLLPSAPPRCIRYLHVLSLCCVRRAHTCSSCSRGHSHQEGSASAAYAAESHAPMCRRHPPLPVASWLRSRCGDTIASGEVLSLPRLHGACSQVTLVPHQHHGHVV